MDGPAAVFPDRRRSAATVAPTAPWHETMPDAMGRHPDATLVAAVASTLLLGVVDWSTGSELAFSTFYLLPIAAMAWGTSRGRWLIVIAVGAATWLLADVAAGQEYSSGFIPFWNTLMRTAVFVVVGALLAQLRRSVFRERELASTDPLTGLLNSRAFLAEAAGLIQRHEGPGLTVMYLDLDDFKRINDEYGHSGGDEALRRVGLALIVETRTGDLVGRVGGDEFALILVVPADFDSKQVTLDLVDRLQVSLEEHEPRVGLSAGAVTFADPPSSVDEAVDAADRLMYEVKGIGKGAVLHQHHAATRSE